MIFPFPRTPSAEKRLDVSRPSYRSCGKQTEARSLTSLIVSSAPPIAGFAERDFVTFAVSAKAGAAVALPSSGGRGLKQPLQWKKLAHDHYADALKLSAVLSWWLVAHQFGASPPEAEEV